MIRWLRDHGPFTVMTLLTLSGLATNLVLLVQDRWVLGVVAYAGTWCAYNGMRATVGLRPWSISTSPDDWEDGRG